MRFGSFARECIGNNCTLCAIRSGNFLCKEAVFDRLIGFGRVMITFSRRQNIADKLFVQCNAMADKSHLLRIELSTDRCHHIQAHVRKHRIAHMEVK